MAVILDGKAVAQKTKDELKKLYPQISEKILRMAYEKIPQFTAEVSK